MFDGSLLACIEKAMEKAHRNRKGVSKWMMLNQLMKMWLRGNTCDGNSSLIEVEFANKVMEETQQTRDGGGLMKWVGNRTAEHRTDGTESHDVDEFCEVEDAYETMLAEGISVYQKKQQLEKLKSIECEKIKEMSNEWKTITAEGRNLKWKKTCLPQSLQRR
ncbi:unnamed protein product [Cochlearia groenlandica]